MRNVEKIKGLRHELGRYQKKVADQDKEVARLRRLLDQAEKGNRETQAILDAILTATALRYGEDAVDPDDTSKVLGKRLTLPCFNFLEMRQKYEIHARKDEETGGYIIGVAEREEIGVPTGPQGPVGRGDAREPSETWPEAGASGADFAATM